jgi:hypothetical protein
MNKSLSAFDLEIVERLLAGLPADTALGLVEHAGGDAQDFQAQLERIYRDRFAELRRFEITQDHAAWMLSVRRRLHADGHEIPRMSAASADFYRGYYLRNRPVVLTDLHDSEAAPFTWTFERIAATFADAAITVMRGPALEPGFLFNEARKRETTTLGRYIGQILEADGDDSYLTSDNDAVSGPLLEVAAELHPPTHLIRGASRSEATLWMGPKGAYTPLHYDPANVLLVSLLGIKRVRLAAPYDFPFMYVEGEQRYSRVDPRKPDLVNFPLFRHARIHDVLVRPNEGLLLPAGWWHAVESVEASLSVSLTGFLGPNSFPQSRI